MTAPAPEMTREELREFVAANLAAHESYPNCACLECRAVRAVLSLLEETHDSIRKQTVFAILDEQIAYILRIGAEIDADEGKDPDADDSYTSHGKTQCFHLMETRRAIEGKPVSFRAPAAPETGESR